jgi:N-acetyl-anhydromuramyl-L-alanine amidase AmpD
MGEELEAPLAHWIRDKKKELDLWTFHINPSVISYIVIHHSLTADGKTVNWDAIRKYHIETNKWLDIGYHFGVENVQDDYQVMLGRNLDKRGAHVGDGGFNRMSIGICVVGNWDKATPPDRQWILTLLLVKRLISYFGSKGIIVPPENIIGHREAQALAEVPVYSRKSCPGNMFDMDRFRKELVTDERIA